jgi:hypothetical protein
MKTKNMIRNNLNSLSGSEKIESNHWQSGQSKIQLFSPWSILETIKSKNTKNMV